MKDVMIVTGAGQISMAIARRMGYGMKIIIGDKKIIKEEMETVYKLDVPLKVEIDTGTNWYEAK